MTSVEQVVTNSLSDVNREMLVLSKRSARKPSMADIRKSVNLTVKETRVLSGLSLKRIRDFEKGLENCKLYDMIVLTQVYQQECKRVHTGLFDGQKMPSMDRMIEGYKSSFARRELGLPK